MQNVSRSFNNSSRMRAADTFNNTIGSGNSVRIIGQESEDEVLMTNLESPRNLLNNIANNLGRNKVQRLPIITAETQLMARTDAYT